MRAAPQYELLPTSRGGGGVHTQASPCPRSSRWLRARPVAALVASAFVGALVFVLSRGSTSRPPRAVHKAVVQTNDALDAAQVVARSVLRFDLSSYEIDNLQSVNVTVAYSQGVVSPGDWIGVYCLEKDSQLLPVDEYLDRRDISGQSVDIVEFGPLVNMRCLLEFRLLASDGTLLAKAPSRVRFRKGFSEPTQLHLAMTDDPKAMRVLWTSGEDVATAGEARVRYGDRANKLDREAQATWATYDADDMCGAPATTRSPRLFRDPGLVHDALMVDLKPGVRYYYQVSSSKGSRATWSDVRQFTIPPAKGVIPADDRPLSMFVMADLMTATSATRDFRIPGSCGTTMELIEKDLLTNPDNRDYTALFHVGDLSYAAGQTSVWDQFGSLIEPVASRIPYMVSIGNHDFGYLEGRESRPERAPKHSVFEMDGTHGHDAHGECGVPTEKRFHMPENGDGIWWYSVDIGLTHHTVLSGEHDFARGSPMYEWLLKDLKSVDRTATPWLFVHIHRPLYCSVAFGGDFTRSLYLRDHLEKIFAEYHVDIVFSGHYHSYERTCPVYDDVCHYGANGESLAPVHIMVGSGGANVDTFGHYSVGWSEYARMTYGYGRLHVFNASHALFEFVENDARRVMDEMWIVTDHKWTRHDDWRWRRLVFHPSLAFSISGSVLSLIIVLGVYLRHRKRYRLAKRN